MSKPAIKAEGLVKSFGATQVLRGIGFEVAPGEVFSLLGPNGAGKTTTVNICATLVRPDAGRVSVGGFDVTRQPGRVRAAISLTGQFAAVDGLLTGRENLVLMAKLRGLKRGRELAADLLDRFGLAAAADRRADTYSGGMVRRLDVAMSLVGDPAVIFLDEPTTGLDPEGRLEVWRTVEQLAAGGAAIFLTTQYLDEAERLASHLAILREGRIVADGTLTELKQMFPPAQKEYVEKQPSLEDVFLAIVGETGQTGQAGQTRKAGQAGETGKNREERRPT
jgi:ABC-2 type transport system ATP-binding protein